MPTFPLPVDGSLGTLAADLSVTPLDLVPAAVAGMVIAALGAALVITALRRGEPERKAVSADEAPPAGSAEEARHLD